MRTRILPILIITVLLGVLFGGCSKKGGLTSVTLNEVTHSIFYAPQYVAIEKGYFEEEGLNVKLVNGLGADKTMTALLSGDCDIGFMGSEASIYVYVQGAQDYAVNFAQLTQRAGNFIVSKDVNEKFSWENVKNKTVIGGRVGGMPEMVFEYVLKKNGIDPRKDLKIIQNIDFGMTAEAFASGQGDYTIEFEPSAQALEREGKGKVVASIGVESGMIPYTAYAAKKSYIEANPKVIQSFVNAIQKGLDYVNSHSPEEIVKVIKPQFPEENEASLVHIVTRYYNQDTWKENAIFEKESFVLLEKILEEAGELTEKVPYEDLINKEYALKAAK